MTFFAFEIERLIGLNSHKCNVNLQVFLDTDIGKKTGGSSVRTLQKKKNPDP